jgi:hypothetical protein
MRSGRLGSMSTRLTTGLLGRALSYSDGRQRAGSIFNVVVLPLARAFVGTLPSLDSSLSLRMGSPEQSLQARSRGGQVAKPPDREMAMAA